MAISTRIDWISAVFDGQTIPAAVFPELEWEQNGRGKHSYAVQQIDKLTGAIAQCDNEPGRASLLVSFGGKALENWRVLSRVSPDSLYSPLMKMVVRGGRFTRVDFAADFRNEPISTLMLFSALECGEAITTTRTWFFGQGRHNESRQGETLYLGSRTSPLFMRVYNKAAELKLPLSELWTRAEVEVKGQKADLHARQSLNGNVPAVTRALCARMLTWGNDAYTRFLAGEWADLESVPRKEPKTERWLRQDVSKTYARVTNENPSFEDGWNAAVAAYRRALKGEE